MSQHADIVEMVLWLNPFQVYCHNQNVLQNIFHYIVKFDS